MINYKRKQKKAPSYVSLNYFKDTIITVLHTFVLVNRTVETQPIIGA